MMESLIDRVIRHEGFRALPYFDSLGFKTVGIGHCLTKDECDTYKDGITYDQALDLLESDLAKTKENCAKEFPWVLGLDDCRASVVFEMVFQLGVGGVSKFKKVIAAIRIQDWSTAAHEMLNSAWHKQTPGRCEELAILMLHGEETDA